MSTAKSKNTRNEEFKKGLEKEDVQSLVKTLEKIEQKGNAEMIIPIIQLGIKRQEREIQDVITRILFGIKISAAHPIILEQLKDMPSTPFRRVLVSAVWESEINGLDYLDTFVKIALEGDLYEAIECLTVIEESEGELNEEKILDSMLLLKDYMSNPDNASNEKAVIIESIASKVSDMNKGFK
jgi:hypothetical protein